MDSYPVGPGWWPLLATHLPAIFASDEEISKVDIKEKYGTLRVDFVSGSEEAFRVADIILHQSEETCENCGGHRTPDGRQPWCQRCRAATPDEFREIRNTAEQAYLHGSYLRQGPPKDRSQYRNCRLKDI